MICHEERIFLWNRAEDLQMNDFPFAAIIATVAVVVLAIIAVGVYFAFVSN